jgi:hypothetical protein
VALLLLSGRPGAGKTQVGNWLASEHGFSFVESDAKWSTWGPRLCVQALDQAVETFNLARLRGPDVVIEWGFKLEYLNSVRTLRTVGFDAWWLDGDEAACRQGYLSRKGNSPSVLSAYDIQVQAIDAASSRLERFFGDHLIRTVESGPRYMPLEEIASAMLSSLSK